MDGGHTSVQRLLCIQQTGTIFLMNITPVSWWLQRALMYRIVAIAHVLTFVPSLWGGLRTKSRQKARPSGETYLLSKSPIDTSGFLLAHYSILLCLLPAVGRHLDLPLSVKLVGPVPLS